MQQLFEEVLTNVRVIPVEPAGVEFLVAEGDLGPIKKQVAALVERSMARGLDLLRERVAERALRALHCLDPCGRVEVWVLRSSGRARTMSGRSNHKPDSSCPHALQNAFS